MNNMAQLTVSKALDTSHLDVKFPFKAKYGNFINGQWEEPKSGEYFDNTSPITGEVICEIARSNAEDVEFALDAAHGAKEAWGKTSTTERSNMLLKIAQVIIRGHQHGCTNHGVTCMRGYSLQQIEPYGIV